jgi:hypothetical protein
MAPTIDERETDLVKAEFFGERDTEFGHASLHAIIGAIQPRVPLYAPVLHSGERFR